MIIRIALNFDTKYTKNSGSPAPLYVMKKILITISFCLTVLGLFAQSKRASRVSPWDSLYFKNEISLDVSPAVSLLLGGIGASESYGFTYRHFFSKKDAIRAAYRSTLIDEAYDPYVEDIGYRAIPGRTDSIVLITHVRDVKESTDWHTFRVGYEHRFGKRRVKFFLGADLVTGIEKWERIEGQRSYESTQFLRLSDTTWLFPVTPYFYAIYPRITNTLSLMIGFSTVFGVNVNLSKRWSLNGSVVWDFFGYFPFKKSEFADYYHVKDVDSTVEAPITDISVTYHFGR